MENHHPRYDIKKILHQGEFLGRADDGNRTHDLIITSNVLCQLSYIGNGRDFTIVIYL